MSVWDAPASPGTRDLTIVRAPAPEPIDPPLDFAHESRFIRLARELAMEMRGTDQILASYGVGAAEWESLSRSPWFQKTLSQEMAQWNAASTTHERVKLKSAILVEEYLSEANARLRDPNETLSSKVELFKTLARIANLGTGDGESSGGGFRVVINIAGAPAVTRTINVARPVEDIEDVSVEREHAMRHEAERKQDSVSLPGTRITIREQDLDPPTVPGRPPPSERPPAELSARSLMSRGRR